MRLLVIRHAIAEDPAIFAATGRKDEERPLTERGRRRMRRATRGLRRLVPDIGVIGTSPLVRAVETAEIVRRAYRGVAVTVVNELLPSGQPDALAPWLGVQRSHDVVAAVGHEPALSRWVSWLLGGAGHACVEFRKGGVCCLDLAAPDPGSATLEWLLTPGQLRRMAQ